jgi:hypothetical protein
MKDKLTLFLDNNHGFVGLECSACNDDGNPVNLHVGLYPSCIDETKGEHQQYITSIAQEKSLRKKYEQSKMILENKLHEFTNSHAPELEQLKQEIQSLTESFEKKLQLLDRRKKGIFKNRPLYVTYTEQETSAINTFVQAEPTKQLSLPYRVLTTPSWSLMGKVLSIQLHDFNRNNYCFAHEGLEDGRYPSGLYFKRHEPYRSIESRNNIPHISYEISPEASRRVFNKIKYLTETHGKSYAYNAYLHNCIFVGKEMYQEAGLGDGKLLSPIYNTTSLDYFSFTNAYITIHDVASQASLFADIAALLVLLKLIKICLLPYFIGTVKTHSQSPARSNHQAIDLEAQSLVNADQSQLHKIAFSQQTQRKIKKPQAENARFFAAEPAKNDDRIKERNKYCTIL